MKKTHRRLCKLTALLLSAAMASTFVTACGTGEKGGGDSNSKDSTSQVTIGLPYEMETMDVSNYSGDSSLMVIRLCTEQLLRNVDGQAEPGIAETYDVSEDGRSYTFHLRDCTFSDGTEITADDVYYTVMRTLDPEKAMETAYHVFAIDNAEEYYTGDCSAEEVGVKVIDSKTIEITTEEAAYPLFFTDTVFTPLKKDLVEDAKEAYGSEAEYFCNSGPYIMTEWAHESEVVLEKNPDYWNADAIKTDKIIGKINVSGQTAYDMMSAGELDVCQFYGSMDEVNGLMEEGGFEDYTFVSTAQLLNINHKGKTEETGRWLSNLNFRKALTYAIDRESIVKACAPTDEAATRVSNPSLQGVEGHFNEEYPYEGWPTGGDEAKAKEYLEKAMTELGASSVEEIPELTLLCLESNNNMSYLNAISDMWKKKLGVRSTIDAQPLNTMLDKMNNTGEFDLVKGGKSYGIVDWADEIASPLKSTQGNPNNYVSDEYDELYRNTLRSKDWKERKDNLFKLEQYYCDNVLNIVLTWTTQHAVHSDHISGFKTTSDGYLDCTYVEVN